MKYFLDTEFLEGTQKKWFGETKPTIDLISIGIVGEDSREYYAISKDFNLKEAWNRWQQRNGEGDRNNIEPRHYWIRENVLKSIWLEKCKEGFSFKDSPMTPYGIETLFTYKNFKKLILKYGKTNKQIAEDIIEFCKPIDGEPVRWNKSRFENVNIGRENTYTKSTFGVEYICKRTAPQFYAYYADYDHVCLAWLYGRMINFPNGFPQYTKDIQQMIDDNSINKELLLREIPQINCHNSLQDAIWNKKAYNWIVKQLQ